MKLFNKLGRRIKNALTKTVVVQRTVEIEHVPCKVIQLCHVTRDIKDMICENLLDGSIVEMKNVKQLRQPGSTIYMRYEKVV